MANFLAIEVKDSYYFEIVKGLSSRNIDRRSASRGFRARVYFCTGQSLFSIYLRLFEMRSCGTTAEQRVSQRGARVRFQGSRCDCRATFPSHGERPSCRGYLDRSKRDRQNGYSPSLAPSSPSSWPHLAASRPHSRLITHTLSSIDATLAINHTHYRQLTRHSPVALHDTRPLLCTILPKRNAATAFVR